jgi:hypothetical protein
MRCKLLNLQRIEGILKIFLDDLRKKVFMCGYAAKNEPYYLS